MNDSSTVALTRNPENRVAHLMIEQRRKVLRAVFAFKRYSDLDTSSVRITGGEYVLLRALRPKDGETVDLSSVGKIFAAERKPEAFQLGVVGSRTVSPRNPPLAKLLRSGARRLLSLKR